MNLPKPSNPPPDDERIDQALSMPETEQLDFKRVKSVESIVKTISAMANTKGGWIVLGVDDPKKAQGRDRVYGVEENAEAMGEIERHFSSRVNPPLIDPHVSKITQHAICCTLRDGNVGSVVLLRIPQSNAVHSLIDGGTYARAQCTNRQLSAVEITELSLRRGTQSAVDAPVDVPIELLDTVWWKEYAQARQLTRPIAEQLRHLGLAKRTPDGKWMPTCAAVLLFAESPGGLLQKKCAIRVFHYRGHQIEYKQDTNLLRPPVTIDGPVLHQIREAVKVVMNELESGVQVSQTGFEIRQKYPRRVIQEAITNAVIHRDFRLSSDIHIRVFANRIEIESPGVFPGAVTAENLGRVGSRPRNRALTDHLREFPNPPNLDAGEGVQMMIRTLEEGGLYPPVYRTEDELGREVVQVDLLNEARQSEWELVRDYLKDHDTVSNADVRRITNTKSNVTASKLLREWVDNGLLEVANPDVGTRNRLYRLKGKVTLAAFDLINRLLSDALGKQSGNPRK